MFGLTLRYWDIECISQVFRLPDSCVLLEVHQVLKRAKNLLYIAESSTQALRAEFDDITSFSGL